MRQTRPTRLFVPTITDLHPDHKFVNSEAMISIFHAQGTIWPELGEPIPQIPAIYEYATYSNFVTPPTLRIRVSEDLFERKINGLLSYVSQKQIDITIQMQRENGCDEFIREAEFDIFVPQRCKDLFAEAENCRNSQNAATLTTERGANVRSVEASCLSRRPLRASRRTETSGRGRSKMVV